MNLKQTWEWFMGDPYEHVSAHYNNVTGQYVPGRNVYTLPLWKVVFRRSLGAVILFLALFVTVLIPVLISELAGTLGTVGCVLVYLTVLFTIIARVVQDP